MAKSKKSKVDLDNDEFTPKITKSKNKKSNPPSPQTNISPNQEQPAVDPVTFAMEALVDGNTEMRVVAMLKKNYPSITNDKYCSQIMTEARSTFANRSKDDKEYLRNKYRDMYLSLYVLAKKAGHYSTAKDIINNLCEIDKINDDGKNKFVANITYSQFDPKDGK